jgi:hypothetical protein
MIGVSRSSDQVHQAVAQAEIGEDEEAGHRRDCHDHAVPIRPKIAKGDRNRSKQREQRNPTPGTGSDRG